MVELGTLGVVALLLIVVVLFSPVGLGGGLLYVPILHYLAGLPFETAILGSLVMVLCTALGSAQAHRTEQLVSMDRVKVAVITALPAASIGASKHPALPENGENDPASSSRSLLSSVQLELRLLLPVREFDRVTKNPSINLL